MYKSKIILVVLFSINIFQSHAQIQISEKFSQISDIIERNYVDSVSFDTLEKRLLNTVLHEFDPHSAYFTKEEILDMNNRLSGHFKGIGIKYNILEDTIIIAMVQENSPAEKYGLKIGDRIISIDGVPVANKKMSQNQIHTLLSGKKGTFVFISLINPMFPTHRTVKIKREQISYSSIEASYPINDSTAFIKLSRFASISGRELRKELIKYKNNNVKNIILDLRNNGGGLLSAAIDVASEFLKPNKVIVSTNGAHLNRKVFFSSRKLGPVYNGNLVVLVNEYSASASEIVAGALQDWDRAILVGRRTFGKALVQKPYTLKDGSVIRLTVGRYTLPSGRLIQKNFNKGYSSYRMDIQNRITSGQLSNIEKNIPIDSSIYKSLVYGRHLYSYEGIMPDYFIALDTALYSTEQKDFIASGLFNKKLIDLSINNLLFKNYTQETFIQQFVFTPEILHQIGFLSLLNNNSSNISITQNKNFLLLAKAFLGEYLFAKGTYYKILNQNDEYILKALQVFTNWKNFSNFTAYNETHE